MRAGPVGSITQATVWVGLVGSWGAANTAPSGLSAAVTAPAEKGSSMGAPACSGPDVGSGAAVDGGVVAAVVVVVDAAFGWCAGGAALGFDGPELQDASAAAARATVAPNCRRRSRVPRLGPVWPRPAARTGGA